MRRQAGRGVKTIGLFNLSACLLFATTASAAMAAGDAKRGEELSRLHCARCHVVADDMPFAGIGSTPSFMLMVNYLADWEDRFQTFYARRPHPVHVRVKGLDSLTNLPSNAAPIDIELADVEDILSYVRTLKKTE